MELLILFVVGWVLKATWDDKVTDLRDSERGVADRIDRAHPGWTEDRRRSALKNARRRHTAGWLAYQLRHGWIPTVGDIVDGYRAARIGHAEWVAQRPDEPDGWWQRCKRAWKAGWAGAKKATGAKAKVKAAAAHAKAAASRAPASPDTGTTAAGASVPQSPKTPPPAPPPRPQAPPVNAREGTSMAGETGGYAGAQQLADGYNASLTAAAEQLEQYEADLIAGGMSKDPAAMATLAQMREGLETARAAVGGHKAALNGHEQGAEYATSKGEAAASTGWLGGGQ